MLLHSSFPMFKGSRFPATVLIIGHAHLSFSVCVKYHSHRIISNHKLPGAAVSVWHRTKFGTQHKIRACLELCAFICVHVLHVCMCMQV